METANIPAPSIPRKTDWLKVGLMVLPIVVLINVLIFISAAKTINTLRPKTPATIPSPTPEPTITEKMSENLQDWFIYNIKSAGAFNYPANWQIIESYQNKPFVKQCSGPLFQNTNEPTSVIAVEVFNLLRKEEFPPCWKSGNNNDTYQRQIKTLDPAKTINVVKWRSGEEEVIAGTVQKNLWHGDLLQEFSFTNQSKTVRVTFALLYQNSKDRTAELTYDRLLSTFAFIDDDPLLLNPNWKNQTISLYGINLSFPSLWNLQEINKNGDCADYVITSSNGYFALTLKMPCEKPLENAADIITEPRYFGPEENRSSYLQVSDQVIKSIKKL